MTKLKLYLETSVWNFCFANDAPDRQTTTLQFFEQLKQGVYDIFVSEVVFQEIDQASPEKRVLLHTLITEYQPETLKINPVPPPDVERLGSIHTRSGHPYTQVFMYLINLKIID